MYKQTNLLWCFGLGLLVSGVLACSSTKSTPITKPMELYLPLDQQNQTSVIAIPLNLTIPYIQQMLNDQIKGVIYEDKRFDDGDNVTLVASKAGTIVTRVVGKGLGYKVPLKIQAKYKTLVATLAAEGELEIEFTTLFQFLSDWQVSTQTKLVTHRWTKPLKLDAGITKITVSGIADRVIMKSQSVIEEGIDKGINEQLDIKGQVVQAWELLHKPSLIAPDYKAWLLANPVSIGMAPITTTRDSFKTVLFAECNPQVLLGREPQATPVRQLPLLLNAPPNAGKGFQLRVALDVPYEEAEGISKKYLVDSTFTQAGKSVTVKDMQLYGQNEKVIIQTLLSGAYNGNIYLEGIPVYNRERNKIDIQNLDFSLETRNVLFKTASWLVKSNIKKMIQESADYYLDYNLKSMKDEMQKQIENYPLGYGMSIQGKLNTLSLDDVKLSPNGFILFANLSGDIQLSIGDIR